MPTSNKEKEATVSYELASSLLDYNPDTGTITWKVSRGSVKKGSIVGANHPNGYLRVKINRAQFLAHRLAWLLYYKEWPSIMIDHIDGDILNNKIDNLRLCNHIENRHNVGINKNNTSGFKGVSLHKPTGKYLVLISIEGKQKNLGYFHTAEEASEVYNKAAKQVHDEFYKDTRI